MLYELLLELKNFFVTDKYFGTFEIWDSEIAGNCDIKQGQYFRIIGSTFNDGVYQFTSQLELTNEVFDGAIWALAIPKPVIELAEEIEEWQEKYGKADSVNMSPFKSESFGGYSYSKDGGGSGDGTSGTWQSAFEPKLTIWRKIRI